MKVTHPKFAERWDNLLFISIVKLQFKSKTPCLAQSDKSELVLFIPRSSLNSANMFLSESLGFSLFPKLNARPCALPGVGYGSCPRITTLRSFILK
jgi:hypothetical protein